MSAQSQKPHYMDPYLHLKPVALASPWASSSRRAFTSLCFDSSPGGGQGHGGKGRGRGSFGLRGAYVYIIYIYIHTSHMLYLQYIYIHMGLDDSTIVWRSICGVRY